jgi:hypothetical protein
MPTHTRRPVALLIIAAVALVTPHASATCNPEGPFTPDGLYKGIEARVCCSDTNNGQLHWWTIQLRNRYTKTVDVEWRVVTPAYGADTVNCCRHKLAPGETADFIFRTTVVGCSGTIKYQILSVKDQE